MAVDFTIKAFLWFKDPDAGKKGSDKIWGWVEVEGKLYNFWGRRAEAADTRKHLTFKLNPGRWGQSRPADADAQEAGKGLSEHSLQSAGRRRISDDRGDLSGLRQVLQEPADDGQAGRQHQEHGSAGCGRRSLMAGLIMGILWILLALGLFFNAGWWWRDGHKGFALLSILGGSVAILGQMTSALAWLGQHLPVH